jgi:hypothetical protein
MREHVTFWLAFGFALVAVGELRAQGFLIPDTTRTDMVFDFAGQNLYFSTSTGLIKTFHLSTRTFGTSYNLGGSLWGIDIARDNSFLLTAQNNFGISQGFFQRVDLPTGTITNIPYTLAFGEGGAWDVAIASNGLALVTTQFQGSGWTPLRQIDLSTNVITVRTDDPGSGGDGMVRQDTQIERSADGTRLFFMESNDSGGPVFTYSSITNTFGPSANTNAFLEVASGAVNRTGGIVALRTYGSPASLNTAPDFNFLYSFNDIDSGVAFDAARDVFYGVDSTTSQIIAYSTTTFGELFRLDIGEQVPSGSTIFGTGTLVASANGGWLALETDSGIRLFQLAAPTPTPTPTPSPPHLTPPPRATPPRPTPAGTPQPTATATSTATPPTPTPTPTSTSRPRPTPRSAFTPGVRPAPPPHLTPPPTPTGSPRPTPAPRP